MSVHAIALIAQGEPEVDHPRPERVRLGQPRRCTWNVHTSEGDDLWAGIWTCTPGAWDIAMGPWEEEMFTVLEGRCRLTAADDGHAVEAGPGESLVIPAGFRGTFEVLQALRKHYLIVDRRPATRAPEQQG